MDITVKRFDKSLPLPTYDGEAGCFDLFCRETLTVESQEVKLLPVNIAVRVPKGSVLLIFARSSTPWKKGLMLANGVGVVDPFYCGDSDEILIEVFNFRDRAVEIKKGESLAQGMIIRADKIHWNEVEKMPDKGHGGYSIDE